MSLDWTLDCTLDYVTGLDSGLWTNNSLAGKQTKVDTHITTVRCDLCKKQHDQKHK